MAQAIVLFASEAAGTGRGLGEEMKMRVRLVLAELRKEPDRHIFFTKGAPGYEPPELFSNLVCKKLEEGGIAPERIKVFGSSRSTASEIDAAEQFLSEQPKYNQIYAASTWYHVPRIRLLWLLRHRRRAGSLHLWMFRKCVLKRAALELLKLLLIPLPAGTQDRLGQRMRALELM